jgi:hypothetical protein
MNYCNSKLLHVKSNHNESSKETKHRIKKQKRKLISDAAKKVRRKDLSEDPVEVPA